MKVGTIQSLEAINSTQTNIYDTIKLLENTKKRFRENVHLTEFCHR